jgi:hypothetical protein
VLVQFAPVACQPDELNLRPPQVDTNPQPLLTCMKLWICHLELRETRSEGAQQFTLSDD